MIMRIKCDTCIHRVLSDETSVGCGFVPICNKGYWSGECEDVEEGYCTYRDNCADYAENWQAFTGREKVKKFDPIIKF